MAKKIITNLFKGWKISKTGISKNFFWLNWWYCGLPCIDITIPWFFSKFSKNDGFNCITIFEFKFSRRYFYNYKKIADGEIPYYQDCGHYANINGFDLEILNQRFHIEAIWETCGNWFQLSRERRAVSASLHFNVLSFKSFFIKKTFNSTMKIVSLGSINYPSDGHCIKEVIAYTEDLYSGDPPSDALHISDCVIDELMQDSHIKYWFTSGKVRQIRFESLRVFNRVAERLRNLGYEVYTIDDFKNLTIRYTEPQTK